MRWPRCWPGSQKRSHTGRAGGRQAAPTTFPHRRTTSSPKRHATARVRGIGHPSGRSEDNVPARRFCDRGPELPRTPYTHSPLHPKVAEFFFHASGSIVSIWRSWDPENGHSLDPRREASPSALRASSGPMPAACSRSVAVERIWATSELVSRSVLVSSTAVASRAASSANSRTSSG
jgi:hypothetical protein